MSDEKEMPLLGHVGELRKHLFRIIIVVAILALAIGFNIKWFTDNVVFAPATNDFISIKLLNQFFDSINLPDTQFKYKENFVIQQKDLPEAFNLSIKMSVIAGIIAAFPYIVFEMWRFVAPGLKPSEKKNATFYLSFTSILFFLGAAFGYFIISPIAIQFFINYSISDHIEKIITITSVINMILTSTLGMAIMFLFPVLSYVLSYAGMITPQMLRKYRRQAFIVILVISAIITPSDIISMFVAALPLLLLYELSIWISASVNRRKAKEELS